MRGRTPWRAALLTACLAGLTSGGAVAAADDPSTAADEIGPAIGAEAPDFRLTSVTDGTEHTLSEHRGERPVVMVFFRGAW